MDEIQNSVEMADGSVMLPDDGPGETAAGADDQTRGESQTAEPDDIDLSQPMFGYTDPETGEERQFTGEEILAMIQGKTADQGGKTAQTQQAQEEEGAAQAPVMSPDMPQVEPLDYGKVGEVYVAMLEGGDPERNIPGPEAMGQMFGEFVTRHVATSPEMQNIIAAQVAQVLAQRDTESRFVKDFGDPRQKAQDVADWKKANPTYAKLPDEAAYLLMENQSLKRQLADVQSGSSKAVKDAEAKGKQAGEAETVKNIQTKRAILRPLTGGGTGARGPVTTKDQTGKFADIKSKYDLTDPDQRARAMAEGVSRMRGQG